MSEDAEFWSIVHISGKMTIAEFNCYLEVGQDAAIEIHGMEDYCKARALARDGRSFEASNVLGLEIRALPLGWKG